MLNIGYEHYVAKDKVLTILSCGGGTPGTGILRVIQNAEENKKLIVATEGHKRRSVLVLADGVVVVSAVTSQRLKERMLETW